MNQRYGANSFTQIRNRIPALCLCCLLTLGALGLGSCDKLPFGKKKDTAPATGTAPQSTAPGGAAATTTLKVGGATATLEDQGYNEELIGEAGMDAFRTGFEKEAGRDDPFVPVEYTSISPPKMMQENPDQYRVIGTAVSADGQPVALLQLGAETFVVHEGDKLDKTEVRKINYYSVELNTDGEPYTLSMRTRTRQPTEEPQAAQNKLKEMAQSAKSLDALYNQYLKEKYGDKDTAAAPDADTETKKKAPNDFPGFLNQQNNNSFGNSNACSCISVL